MKALHHFFFYTGDIFIETCRVFLAEFLQPFEEGFILLHKEFDDGIFQIREIFFIGKRNTVIILLTGKTL